MEAKIKRNEHVVVVAFTSVEARTDDEACAFVRQTLLNRGVHHACTSTPDQAIFRSERERLLEEADANRNQDGD